MPFAQKMDSDDLNMMLAERYILRRVLALTMMTLVATTLIVLITQVLIYVNVLTDSGEAIATFFQLGVMLIPAMINIVIPFALLIGATQTLNTMHNDSEIVVLEAAGGSSAVVARPIMAVAIAMALATLVNSMWVEPVANRNLRDIINTAGSNLVRFAVRSGSFHRVEEDLYIQIAGQAPSGEFEGILIADMRNPASELIYYARRGAIHQRDGLDVLFMANGEVHRKNESTGEVSIITFQTYTLDFTQFGPTSAAGGYAPKERTTAYLLNPDPDDRFLKQQPEVIRAELHRRFSDWLYPLAFGLIAVFYSAGVRSNREERLWSIAAAVGIALVFRALGFLTLNNAGTSTLFAVASYLVPISAIVLFGGLVMSGRKARISQAWLDRVSAIFGALQRNLGDGKPRREGGTA